MCFYCYEEINEDDQCKYYLRDSFRYQARTQLLSLFPLHRRRVSWPVPSLPFPGGKLSPSLFIGARGWLCSWACCCSALYCTSIQAGTVHGKYSFPILTLSFFHYMSAFHDHRLQRSMISVSSTTIANMATTVTQRSFIWIV